MFTVPVLVGITLAPVIILLGRLSGLDRDRAMYPITLIVIAAYYVLFSTMGGAEALPAELVAATMFAAIAIIGVPHQPAVGGGRNTGQCLFDWVVRPHLLCVRSSSR